MAALQHISGEPEALTFHACFHSLDVILDEAMVNMVQRSVGQLDGAYTDFDLYFWSQTVTALGDFNGR